MSTAHASVWESSLPWKITSKSINHWIGHEAACNNLKFDAVKVFDATLRQESSCKGKAAWSPL